ncbi:hypothetical protein MOO44_01685 (plasmid) [Nicoliella spurrieriana]|uniref:Uncharacterized protein n=1 Tax=Nicoliella spurrieriana TaxID=2925830 RepID=A0A976RQN1_9LACO|nr:hypothetical protein [Nicoliella spurrieriana]UQS86059.1 hypothetical protein MOO44_01685 [Nicoliella spurrieriana]
MDKYTELKTNQFNDTLPSQYINDALEYVNYFQEDHRGILGTDYANAINYHYANPQRLIHLFNQVNVTLRFKTSDPDQLYKVVLKKSHKPINLDSINKDNVNDVHIVPVSQSDKEMIFHIIDNMVEEYLDETDSVQL